MLWSGPLTSVDLMEAGGEGIKVAYQVLDETRLLFPVSFVLPSVSCLCSLNNLNLVLLTDSGLPWCLQRGGSKEGIPELPDHAL
jgi:hypothetical protein